MKPSSRLDDDLTLLSGFLSGTRDRPDPALIRKYLLSNNKGVAAKAAKCASRFGLIALEPDLKKAYHRFQANPKNDTGCIAKIAIAEAIGILSPQDLDWFILESRATQPEPVYGGTRDAAAEVRISCIESLARFAWQKVGSALVDRIGDKEPKVRMAAIKAVSAFDGPEPEYVLRTKAVCGDAQSEVVGECFRAMNAVDMEGRTQIFKAALDAEDEDIRLEAAFALGESQLPEAFHILMDDWEASLLPARRSVLLYGIGANRSKEAFEFLKDLLDNPSYKKQAAEALKAFPEE